MTRASDLLALSAAQATNAFPGRLEGTVTYAEPGAGLAFLHDGAAGVTLHGNPALLEKLTPGHQAVVEGVTMAGNFAPALLVTNLPAGADPKAAHQWPRPLRLSVEQLQGGAYDSQWIELRGVIRRAEIKPFSDSDAESGTLRLRLELNTAQGRYSIIVPWQPDLTPPAGLAGSVVRVQGVLGSIVNRRGHWVGLLIYSPSIQHVVIERQASPDPFEVPTRRLSDLLRFSPAPLQDERVRLVGTLLRTDLDYFAFIKTPDGALEIRGDLPRSLEAGNVIEASGYPLLLNKRVLLEDCAVRVIRPGPPLEPLPVSVSEALQQDLHGELVRLRGELVQNTMRLNEVLLILNSDGQSVEATVRAGALAGVDRDRIFGLRPGSTLELSGVAQILTAMRWNGSVQPLALRLVMGSGADVAVVRAAPWWTPARFGLVAAVLLAALGSAVAWVTQLRRQVARQTEIIREKVEREAIWRDRSRIAEDIHDDLGASLTQVGFLSRRIQASREKPGEAAALADHIADVARSSVRALDEIVWAVNPRHDSLQSLADYLVKLATEHFSLTNIQCLLDIPAVLPEVNLRAEVRHSLALSVKEALHNVVRHSRARTAALSLTFQDHRLEIVIRDDGIGFRPEANGTRRNGLENMQRRMRQIGGECRLESGPGQGTRIAFSALLGQPTRTSF